MPKPFDATLKQLIRHHPADWLGLIGVTPTEPPVWVDAELSTVSASADAVLRVGEEAYHFEFEAGPDDSLVRRVFMYNAVAHFRTGVPVRSTVLLLRPNAQRAGLTGGVSYHRLAFGFDIVRVWQLPAADFLRGPLGLMPLAVVAQPPRGRTREQMLPEQVDRIIDRATAEAGDRAGEVVTSSFLLAGMYQEMGFLRAIFEKGLTMIESSAFAVMEDLFRERHTREIITTLAIQHFGPPTEEQATKLAAISSIPRLNRLLLRVSKVNSWDALLRGR